MTMWMVRAEEHSRLFQPFLNEGVVAIGWPDIGDLGQYPSRDDMLAAIKTSWPEWKPQAQVNSAGMLFRLCREMKVGDLVITYEKTKRVYAIGEIIGDYEFRPSFDDRDPNVRPVKWTVSNLSRDSLSTTTRNSLGSTLTLFLVPEEAERDVLNVMQTGAPLPAGESAPQTEHDELLHDIEERSLEFIKDRIVALAWDDLQELVAGVLRAMGYKTRVSPSGPDRGKDIVASPDGLGFEDPRIVVEVKHRPQESMGSQHIRSFLGGRHPNDKGLYVSTGGFTRDAHYEAERANIPVTLVELDDLVKLLVENYDNADAVVQRLVPLKRIFWPVS